VSGVGMWDCHTFFYVVGVEISGKVGCVFPVWEDEYCRDV